MKKKIVFCMTSDILYDRRMIRIVKALESEFTIEVISRRLHNEKSDNQYFRASRLKCLFNRGLLFYAEYNLRLLLLLLFKSFDIICSVDYDTLSACSIANVIRSKKLVFDAHEYFEESVEIVDRKLVKRFWTWIGQLFVPTTDIAYTVSESIAKVYSEIHGVQFEVIRNLPKYEELELRPNRYEKKIILYQGVLNEGRKLRDLVHASNFLPDDFSIWMVGEGDISSELKNLQTEHVHFFSWVTPEELAPITRQASLGFNLLDSKSKSYYFSLANKFFDYMHAGVPSLNNNFPEYAGINERYNCCFLTDVSDSKQMAAFIEEALNQEGRWKEKVKNSRLAAKDLCWDKEEKKLIALYKRL
jgi:glycosyltransferase involved in cell wall biosynthesis